MAPIKRTLHLEALQLWNEGLTTTEIGKRLGLTPHGALYRIVKGNELMGRRHYHTRGGIRSTGPRSSSDYRLTERQRAAFDLWESGLGYAEIGRRLGINRGAARCRVLKAIELLDMEALSEMRSAA